MLAGDGSTSEVVVFMVLKQRAVWYHSIMTLLTGMVGTKRLERVTYLAEDDSDDVGC